MKRLNEILTRFLRAANVRWTCYGIVSSFTPYPTTVIKYLTFSNFTEFNQSEESCGKSQGRQVRRMATEIRKMGKNKFIRTLSPQWKRLPFAGRIRNIGGETTRHPRIALLGRGGKYTAENNENKEFKTKFL